MAELSDLQIELAISKGRDLSEREPRAVTACFDRPSGRLVIELSNGCSFAFPPHLAQGLEGATPDQLEQVEVLGSGYGLHWEGLDLDLSVPSLMVGCFGARSFIARQAGQSLSPAKAAASRSNGAKGGRPRKVAGTA